MCKPGWRQSVWAGYDKHHPKGKEWQELIRLSGDGRKIARYKPGTNIRDLEMSYNQPKTPGEAGNWGEYLVTRGNNDQNLADYYVITKDEVIGASLGEETSIVLVRRAQTGEVHGYPITPQELSDYKRDIARGQ